MGCTPSQHSPPPGSNYNHASDPSICDSCKSSGQAADHREGNAVRPSVTANSEQESLCRRLKGNIFLTETSKGHGHDQVQRLFIYLSVCLFRRFSAAGAVHTTDNTSCYVYECPTCSDIGGMPLSMSCQINFALKM